MEKQEELLTLARYGELEEFQYLIGDLENKREAILDKSSGNTCFHMAAANGHIEVLKEILKYLKPNDLDVINDGGSTALHWASLNGHANVVELLLQKGSNPNLKNNAGKSSLTLAAECDHQDVVNILLEAFDDQDSIEEDDEDDISR